MLIPLQWRTQNKNVKRKPSRRALLLRKQNLKRRKNIKQILRQLHKQNSNANRKKKQRDSKLKPMQKQKRKHKLTRLHSQKKPERTLTKKQEWRRSANTKQIRLLPHRQNSNASRKKKQRV